VACQPSGRLEAAAWIAAAPPPQQSCSLGEEGPASLLESPVARVADHRHFGLAAIAGLGSIQHLRASEVGSKGLVAAAGVQAPA